MRAVPWTITHSVMSQPLFRFVALGDSTSAGVGADEDGGFPERLFRKLKAKGVNVGIRNLGVSGATSTDVLNHQVRKAVSLSPALVTLGIGTNDGWRMIPAASFAANLNAIADALQSTGAQVVVSNLSDLGLAPASAAAVSWLGISRSAITERIRELNVEIEKLAARPRFTVVDLFSYSQHELVAHPEYFCGDGFHPSAEGYHRWAELLWPAVEKAADRWEGESAVAGART